MLDAFISNLRSANDDSDQFGIYHYIVCHLGSTISLCLSPRANGVALLAFCCHGFAGNSLILNWNSFDLRHLNAGDFLTLICSLLAAYHIIIVGKRAPLSQNDFAFNTFQSMWTALPCLLLIPISENFQVFQKGSWNLFALDSLGWIGMISLTLGSSLIAFFLQVRAQRVLSPSTASLLFLLESPVSFFFAFTLLGERLSSLQLFGAFLILLSCALISLPKR